MLHGGTGAFRFEMRGFELEVPFCGAVGVIDQHEVGIVLKAFGLQFHGAPILFHKFSEDKLQQMRAERKVPKNVPGRHHVDAALIARDGSNRCQRGKPIFARSNGLPAQIGQDEIDGRGS